MKKFYSFLFVLAFIAIVFAQSANAQNVFFDGFESGNTQGTAITGWTQVSVSGTDVWSANTSLTDYNRTPRTGSWNAFLKYSNTRWMFKSVTLTIGQQYTLSFYARQDGTTGTNIRADYGTAASIAGMTNSIISLTAVTNGSYQFFSGSFTPASSGTFYIGIRADLTSSPWYISIDDISLDATTPLTGTKTIKASGGDYSTFSAAITALNLNGVGVGGVIFNVDPGFTSTEICPAITANGTSLNPIIFQKNGAGTNPKITAGTGVGSSDAIIRIAGGDFITFDGIDVSEAAANVTTTTQMEYGYYIYNASATNGAQYNIIKNSKITLNRTNTSSIGVYQTYSASPTAASGANSYNKFYNLTVENAYNGIYLLGLSAWPDLSTELGITGGGTTTIGSSSANDIGNGSSTTYGIRAAQQQDLKIFNCEVRNVTGTGTSNNVHGIFLDGIKGTTGAVYNNNVHDIKNSSTSNGSTVTGIRADVATGVVVNIYNNFISAISHASTTASATQYVRGLACNVAGGTGTVNSYYNSIRIETSQYVSSSAFYTQSGTANCVDNIFSNFSATNATSKRYCIYLSSGTLTTSNYNDLYILTGTNNFVGYNTSDKTALSDWQSSFSPNKDLNSVTVNPFFTSSLDLHASASGISNKGILITTGNGFPINVTTDIDGQTRPWTGFTNPCIGADEFLAGVDNPESFTATTNSNVQIQLAFQPNASGDNVVIVWNLTGTFSTPSTDPPSVGEAFAGGTLLYNGTGTPQNHSGLTANTTYYYKAFSLHSAKNYPQSSSYSPGLIANATTFTVPNIAVIGSPANGATNIALTQTLNWTSGGGNPAATGYKLYFGTDNPPTNLINGTDLGNVLTYTPTLAYGQTYYWRIAPYNAYGDQTGGTIWSFTTMADPTLTPPFTQTFDVAVPPTNWAIYSGLLAAPSTLTSTTGTWVKTNFSNGVSTSPSARINIYGTGRNHWLVSPPINLGSGGTQYKLEFDLSLTAYGGTTAATLGSDDKFVVVISTDNGVTWTSANSLRTWNSTTPISNGTGDHISISLASYTGTVKIGLYGESTVSNADNDLFVDNFAVNVLPTNPVFSISPTSKAFGELLTGTSSADQTFTISNTGGGTLTITTGNISLTGDNADQFTLTDGNSYPISLSFGASTTVKVKFSPTTAGSKSANLHIVDNIAKSSHDIPLTGSAYDPYASLSENFDGVTTPALPSKWSKYTGTFASVYTSTTYANSTPNSVYLYNENLYDAYLISPALSNFSLNRLKFYAKGGTNYTLKIGTMTDPTNPATFTQFGSTITLTSSFAQYTVDFSTYAGTDKYIAFKHGQYSSYTSIYIDDFIWEAIPTNPIFSISPTSKNFGTVYTGSTSPQLFTITNTGVGTLTINNISALTGTNADQFSLTGVPSTPFDLTAGASQTLTANFVPTSSGAKTAKFTVTHSTSTTVDVNLSGTGQEANYGGGNAGNGSYYFANSTAGANSAPSKPTFNWVDYSSHTVVSTYTSGNGDDGYFTIPDIGFNFNFFGNTYRTNNVHIYSNGAVIFGSAPAANNNYGHSIPGSTGTVHNIIAGLWQDLDMRSASYIGTEIRYGGDANQFVITFVKAHHYLYAGSTNYITFQIILIPKLTGNGDVKIQYNYDLSTTTYSDLDVGYIGIENSDGTLGIGYRNAGVGGPIFDNTLINGPNAIGSLALQNGMDNTALPVNLQSFTFKLNSRDVTLNWVTSKEDNNAGFDIERKPVNSNTWTKISNVPGKGTTNNTVNYSYNDRKLNSGKYNYRLKQIDYNGNYQYYTMFNYVEVGIPTKYDLSQNYPNPFNPTTKIDYALPFDSKVSIILYDITGREVKTLVNNTMKAGFYTEMYNLGGLASGTYFYRIIAKSSDKDYIATKKMVLIK